MWPTTSKLFLIVFFAPASTCVAQSQHLTDQQINSIKNDGLTFLIKNNYFEQNGDTKKYQQRMFYYELVKHEKLGGSNSGIYVFTITSSHTDRFLFILNNEEWKYYSIDSIGDILKDVSSFASDNATPEDVIFEYLEGIITARKSNQSLKGGSLIK